MWWDRSLKVGTYGILGLNEGVVDGSDSDIIMLFAVDSCQRG